MTGVRLKPLRVRSALVAASFIGAAAAPASAQSVNDYRLPTAPPANPRAQGPVTPDNPVILAPRPSPSATTAAPPPAPPPTPAATRTVAPAARPATAPTSRSGERPGAQQPRQPAPAASTPATEAGAALGLPPLTPAAAAPSYAPPPAAATTPAGAETSYWPLIAGALAAVLVVIGGLLFWRRRRAEAAEPVVDFVPPVVAAPPPEILPEPVAEPAPVAPVAEPVAAPPAEPAVQPRGIALAVEAKRMSASLMATTLSYKLTLTNHTDTPLSAVAIEGDMIAAQAQIPQERQVAVPTQPLEARFQIPELAPGESAEFTGDIRVPLSTIVPIRAGAQALFIPLARFRVEAGRNGSGRMAVSRTWVVGEEPEAPGAPLKPFRLDLGPRTYSRIGQRPVD